MPPNKIAKSTRFFERTSLGKILSSIGIMKKEITKETRMLRVINFTPYPMLASTTSKWLLNCSVVLSSMMSPFKISIFSYFSFFKNRKYYSQIVVYLVLVLCPPSYAVDTTSIKSDVDLSWVHDLNALAEKLAKEPNKEAVKIVQQAHKAASNPKVCSAAKLVVKDAHDSLGFKDQKRDGDRYPDLLIFVSFSMSDELLKTLANQAKEKDGKIVFRGLLNGSFKEMGQKLRELGVEALIDPTLFQKHNVFQVPTFLLKDDKLVGNVSLTYALKTFKGEGV